MSELHIWATPMGVRAGYYVIKPDSTELFVDYHDHKFEVAELEAERDLLRDNLKRIRDAVWETGVCGVLAKLEETE